MPPRLRCWSKRAEDCEPGGLSGAPAFEACRASWHLPCALEPGPGISAAVRPASWCATGRRALPNAGGLKPLESELPRGFHNRGAGRRLPKACRTPCFRRGEAAVRVLRAVGRTGVRPACRTRWHLPCALEPGPGIGAGWHRPAPAGMEGCREATFPVQELQLANTSCTGSIRSRIFSWFGGFRRDFRHPPTGLCRLHPVPILHPPPEPGHLAFGVAPR